METRDALLACALERFASRGYDAVGVQEIVEAAGVTKPTLYHHFGSKQGLLEALLNGGSEPFLQRVAEAARYERDLTGNLQRLTSVYLEFARTQPDVYRVLAACTLAPPESVPYSVGRPFQARQLGVLGRLFEQAGRDHGNMRGRSRRYATSFLGLLDGYARLVLTGDIAVDGALEHDIVKQFSYGIYS